jgi:hypothetical protein
MLPEIIICNYAPIDVIAAPKPTWRKWMSEADDGEILIHQSLAA